MAGNITYNISNGIEREGVQIAFRFNRPYNYDDNIIFSKIHHEPYIHRIIIVFTYTQINPSGLLDIFSNHLPRLLFQYRLSLYLVYP